MQAISQREEEKADRLARAHVLSALEVRRQLAVTVARTYLSLVAQHRVIENGAVAIRGDRAAGWILCVRHDLRTPRRTSGDT